MREFTQKQKETFNFILTYNEEKGFYPSMREIGKELGIKPKSVFDRIHALKKKGALAKTNTMARAYTLIIKEKFDI